MIKHIPKEDNNEKKEEQKEAELGKPNRELNQMRSENMDSKDFSIKQFIRRMSQGKSKMPIGTKEQKRKQIYNKSYNNLFYKINSYFNNN